MADITGSARHEHIKYSRSCTHPNPCRCFADLASQRQLGLFSKRWLGPCSRGCRRIDVDGAIISLDSFQRSGDHHLIQKLNIKKGNMIMDKDRIIGTAKTVAGTVKEAAGKAVGDQKTAAAGKAEKVEGKVQNAVGGAKDAIREVFKGK